MTASRRIVIFGTCPLPWEEYPVAGPALRTFQLARPLWEAGHTVLIIALRTPGVYPAGLEHLRVSKPFPGVELCNADYDVFTKRDWVRQKVEAFRPDAIIGAGSLMPNFVASQCADVAPFWADIFGDPISELQSKGGMYGHKATRSDLHHVWNLLTAALLRGDRFSALSEPQRLALIGELALCGRLNALTDGADFVASIPCGVDERDEAGRKKPPALKESERRDAARKLGFGKIYDAAAKGRKRPFILLWAGSFNTWIDEETLFGGIEHAMAADPRVILLSVGGGTAGYNPKIYERFLRRIEESKHKGRFVMHGWRPVGDMPLYYSVSDVGLNVDRFTYEGVLGSRNRVIQFLKYGVPVLTTELSEITRNLAAKNLITTFPIGDAAAFGETSAGMADNLRALVMQAGRGRKFVLEEYNFVKTAQPVIEWAAAPRRAPDNAASLAATGALPSGTAGYTLEFQRCVDAEAMMAAARQSGEPQWKRAIKKAISGRSK